MAVLELLLGVLAVGLIVWAGYEAMVRWDSYRADQQAALRIELEALRAAQRLSLAAWETRQAMRNEARRHEAKDS